MGKVCPFSQKKYFFSNHIESIWRMLKNYSISQKMPYLDIRETCKNGKKRGEEGKTRNCQNAWMAV